MVVPKDQVYIDKVLAGDTSAFAVLVDRHKNVVFSICVRILGNKEEAEEVAQDTFLKAYEKLATFRKEANFSSWLFRIAYNMSISQQRKSKVKKVNLDEYLLDSNTENEIIDELYLESMEEREKKLKAAIQKLESQQQLLLLVTKHQWHTVAA